MSAMRFRQVREAIDASNAADARYARAVRDGATPRDLARLRDQADRAGREAGRLAARWNEDCAAGRAER